MAFARIHHQEEGMRDGLQIEASDIPVESKIHLLDALSETGLRDIAVGSFVSPRWVPQMAQIEALVRGFHPKPGVRYTYTALNEKGHERAREFIPPLSVPESSYATICDLCDVFAQRNTNRTQAEQIANWPRVIERARARGATAGGIGLSNAWGSNWTGEFSHEQRLAMLDRQHQLWLAAGFEVTRVNLADAMSWNMPHHVESILADIKRRWPTITTFNLHLHNGRAMALPSIYAALRVLDSTDTLMLQTSIGGMAGCPYCGNGRAAMMIATEDLMHMLEDMGIATGVDVYKLVEVAWLAEEVVGHPLYGCVSKAGPRPRYDRLYPMDMPQIETFEQAKHFLRGPAAYADSFSPWGNAIRELDAPRARGAAGADIPQRRKPRANGATGRRGAVLARMGAAASEAPAVLYARANNVAWVTINRPANRNALSRAVQRGLLAAFGEATADADIRAIVLTGTGDQAFCAGADLKEYVDDAARRGGVGRDINAIREIPSTTEMILETSKPVIAAVNGWAVAAGCELSLACDIRLASENAKFGLFEARRGLGANFGTVLLQYLVPRGVAMEMLFTGQPIDAARALEIGLVNAVVPPADLHAAAARLAETIAANAPISLRRMKELANKSLGVPPLFALKMGPGPSPYTSEDATEGARAFVEKRPPRWRNR